MGGTFDPPHLGHLVVAEQVREEAELDEVIFVPARIPPHKTGEGMLDAELRRELVEIAVRGNPRFRVSDVELRREGPSYTIDTVDALRRERGPGTDLFLIVGADNVHELGSWKDPAALLEKCTLLVATRPGFDVAELPSWISQRARVVAVAGIAISSREIRDRLRNGRTVRYLVPDAVLDVIENRSLYR
jgi:nicotinate-nucleotide adenylyltransferase